MDLFGLKFYYIGYSIDIIMDPTKKSSLPEEEEYDSDESVFVTVENPTNRKLYKYYFSIIHEKICVFILQESDKSYSLNLATVHKKTLFE